MRLGLTVSAFAMVLLLAPVAAASPLLDPSELVPSDTIVVNENCKIPLSQSPADTAIDITNAATDCAFDLTGRCSDVTPAVRDALARALTAFAH